MSYHLYESLFLAVVPIFGAQSSTTVRECKQRNRAVSYSVLLRADAQRGTGPTVREGSITVHSEPSLTVGLMPRRATHY